MKDVQRELSAGELGRSGDIKWESLETTQGENLEEDGKSPDVTPEGAHA